jgi:hypothetical protein
MIHPLDDGLPIFGDVGDITDPDERYAFFETIPAEKMAYLRNERNRRLAETDWWASSDLTMTAEQTAYRQALRDITQTYTSLEDVVWPTKPEV